jgi:hypothetical protein
VAERALRSVRNTGLVAAGLTVGTGVLLVVLLSSEPGPDLTSRTVLVGAVLAAAAAAAVFGSFARVGRVAAGCLGLAAGILLVTGYLALFSIGLLLVAASVLAAIGAVGEARTTGTWGAAGLAFLAGALAALVPLLGS